MIWTRLFLWRSTCFNCRAQNFGRHKNILEFEMRYLWSGSSNFIEILRIWRIIDSESSDVKIVKNACQEPEILYFQRITSGVLTIPPFLVSKLCQQCPIAMKFIRDMPKSVVLAVVELIWYFIALAADNVTWHSLNCRVKSCARQQQRINMTPYVEWTAKIQKIGIINIIHWNQIG